MDNTKLNKEIVDSLKHWKEIVKKYQIPSPRKAIGQILSSFLPFIALWVLMYFSLQWSIFITIGLGLINAFFLVRIFIIQHDCGHQSFTKSKIWNDIVGYTCSVFSALPYKYWARVHNFHHAHSGVLDTIEIGDIPTLTVNEYRNSSRWAKIRYRIWRNPIITFIIAPIYYIGLSNRWPVFKFNNWKKEIINQLKNNNQHEHSYKQWKDNWNYVVSAIRGSTYYKLPKIFQWMTGNIGIHHIHHLSSLIPNYNLEKCMKENTILNKYVTVVTFWQSFKMISHKLWDEERQRMISFAEYYKFEKLRIA